MSLFVLTTVCAVLLSVYSVSRRFPMEALIMATVLAITAIGVALYIGELVVIGWIVDFLADLGMPKFHAKPSPLEYERVGEIIVVTLRDNIATVGQCQSVEKQLKRLIDEQHCNFVLDFLYVGRVSKNFREVMLRLLKAASSAAEKLGKPDWPVALPRGAVFRVFDDRRRDRRNVRARRTWMGRPLLSARWNPGSRGADVKSKDRRINKCRLSLRESSATFAESL